MNFTIRAARQADYEALCAMWLQLDRLHAEIRPDFFRDPTGPTRTARSLALVLNRDDRAILVAESGGVLVGFATVVAYETPESPLMRTRRRSHVSELVVERSHRRQGIGRALMEAAVEWSRQQGAAQVVLTVWEGNETAEAFYGRLGYKPLSRTLGLELVQKEASSANTLGLESRDDLPGEEGEP